MQTHIRVCTCVYVYVMCGEQLKDATKKCVLLDTHFLKYPNIRNWRMHIVSIPTNITHPWYVAAKTIYFIIIDRVYNRVMKSKKVILMLDITSG